MMGLPRSTFYYQAKTRDKLKADNDLRDKIETVALEFSKYGYRRITRPLKLDGYRVNHKRVLRIMREGNLLVKPRRQWVRTTDSKHGYPSYPNLVKDLVVTTTNQVWVADITYIRILLGFVYLAVILDAFSRKVIGYSISNRLDTELTLQALRMAIAQRKPRQGIIHHSDQGIQYAATNYIQELQNHGFLISMAHKGNPYENALAESFLKTLKTEEVYLWEYETLGMSSAGFPISLKRYIIRSGSIQPWDIYHRMSLNNLSKNKNSNQLASGYSNLCVQT